MQVPQEASMDAEVMACLDARSLSSSSLGSAETQCWFPLAREASCSDFDHASEAAPPPPAAAPTPLHLGSASGAVAVEGSSSAPPQQQQQQQDAGAAVAAWRAAFWGERALSSPPAPLAHAAAAADAGDECSDDNDGDQPMVAATSAQQQQQLQQQQDDAEVLPGSSCSDAMAMLRRHMAVEAELAPARGFLEPLHLSAGAGAAAFAGSSIGGVAAAAAADGGPPTPGMRMIVVSWLVEVAEEFRLQQETLHLALALLDRFLSAARDVPRCVLQLLAVACVLVAGKALEVRQPTVEQLCAVTAHHFKPHDLLRMERIVLDVLAFRVVSPSAYTFLHLLAQACAASVTPGVLSLAMYLCELAALEYAMHEHGPSTRALAALLLAQASVGEAAHAPALARAAAALGRPAAALAPCMATLLQLQQAAYAYGAVADAAAAAAAHQHQHQPRPPGCDGDAAEAIGGLLAPLRAKFGAACWCEVTRLPPLQALPAPLIAGDFF